MSVKLYDDALVSKIESWTKSKIPILKPDESTRLFRLIADNKQDKPLTLPQFVLSRDRDIEILEMEKQPKSFKGYKIGQTKEQTMMLNVIPISLSYQLDIYTVTMEEAVNYMREFVFKFVNNPRLVVDIPYNGCKVQHNATMYLNSTISDNSDINEHLFADEFYRYTIRIIIDDAYLFSAPIENNVEFVIDSIRTDDNSIDETID